MYAKLLEELEVALRQRNPQLAKRLQSGISEARIRRMLDRSKARGAIEPVVSLFSWKNGTDNFCNELSKEQASPFPKSVYMFMELDMLLGHFAGFEECLTYHPEYARVVGRYFPLFWDGSNSWLAVDLDPVGHNRIVLVHTEFEQMLFEAYDSFEQFLKDAIQANQKGVSLSCFEALKPLP